MIGVTPHGPTIAAGIALLVGAIASGHGLPGFRDAVPDRLESVPDALRIRHTGYEAAFARDGWVTWRPTSDSSGTVTWRYRLDALISGTAVSAFEAVVPQAIDGGVEYRRHGVVERYVGREAGIEQVFEITRPTPGGLRLRGHAPVPPGAVSAVVQGHVIVRFEDGRTLTYSKPVAYDGLHAPLPVRVEVAADTLDLVIDAVDLAGRPYPVTIDPLVSAPQQVSTGFADDVRVAHDAQTGDFLVVYRELDRIFGQTLTAAAVPNGSAFELCWRCEEPRVASNGDYFLVVWRSVEDSQIQGRFVRGGQPEPYGFVDISLADESSGRHAEVAATNDGFIVAWIGQDAFTNGVDRVRTSRVWPLDNRGPIHSVDITGTGAVLNDVVPGLAFDPSRDRALVAYSNGGRVYGSWVGVNGLIGFPGQINVSGSVRTVSAAFDHVSRRYLVVWADPVRAALLNDDLSKISEFPIVMRNPLPIDPRVDVVTEGGGFMLTYTNLGAMDPPYNFPVDLAHRLVTSTGVVTDLGLLTTDGAANRDFSASMARGEGGLGMLVFARHGDTVGGAFAAVTARPAPRITAQPQTAMIASGATAQLTVATSGGPYSFQWYAGYRPPSGQSIAGASGSSYTTPPLTEDASYWVRVTNANGISTDSRAATITVATPPTITQTPASQTVVLGQTATLAAAATGTGILAFQRYQGPSGVVTSPVAGATSNVYVTPPLTATTSYWVRVTNVYGSANSTAALLTVVTAPTITQAPASQTIGHGQTANVSVVATGTAPLAFQWYQGPSGVVTSPIPGATASAYVTPPLTATTSYWVRVTNVYGSANSLAAVITVTAAPPPTTVGDAYSAAFQTPLTVAAPGVLANDLANGAPTLAAELVATTTSGALSLNADGGFTYSPNASFVGTDTFSYRALGNGAGAPAIVTLTVLQPTTPQPPSALTVDDVAGDLVTLRWTAPEGEIVPTGYVLQGGLRPGDTIAALDTGSADPVFTFRAPAGSFFVRMLAVASGGQSAPSSDVPLHVSVPVTPTAPRALTGLAVGGTLDLRWKNTFGGGPPTGLSLDVTGAIAASVPLPVTDRFTFHGVPDGTYTFRLRATNDGGTSPASTPVTLAFPGTCAPPAPPRNVLAYRVGTTISIVWDPPASGAASTAYLLGVTSTVFTGDVAVASPNFSTVAPAGTYTFVVRSSNPCGTSAASPRQTVTIP